MDDIAPIRDGRTWVFPDGTRLPVVSGGSDQGLAAGGPPAGAGSSPAPATGPPAGQAPPPAPVEGGEPAGVTPGGEPNWKQIAEARGREAAQWRARVRSYEALDPDTQQAVHTFVDAYARGDVDGVLDWLAASGQAVGGEDFAARLAQAAGVDPGSQGQTAATPGQQQAPPPGQQQQGEPPLTAAQIEQILDQREQRQAMAGRYQQAVVTEREAILGELKELGWDDPHHPMVPALVQRARLFHGGDIRAAHEAMMTDIQSIAVNDAQRRQGAARTAGIPSPNGVPPGGEDTRTPEQRMEDRVHAWPAEGNVG